MSQASKNAGSHSRTKFSTKHRPKHTQKHATQPRNHRKTEKDGNPSKKTPKRGAKKSVLRPKNTQNREFEDYFKKQSGRSKKKSGRAHKKPRKAPQSRKISIELAQNDGISSFSSDSGSFKENRHTNLKPDQPQTPLHKSTTPQKSKKPKKKSQSRSKLRLLEKLQKQKLLRSKLSSEKTRARLAKNGSYAEQSAESP